MHITSEKGRQHKHTIQCRDARKFRRFGSAGPQRKYFSNTRYNHFHTRPTQQRIFRREPRNNRTKDMPRLVDSLLLVLFF